jgi:hypothetical protein
MQNTGSLKRKREYCVNDECIYCKPILKKMKLYDELFLQKFDKGVSGVVGEVDNKFIKDLFPELNGIIEEPVQEDLVSKFWF